MFIWSLLNKDRVVVVVRSALALGGNLLDLFTTRSDREFRKSHEKLYFYNLSTRSSYIIFYKVELKRKRISIDTPEPLFTDKQDLNIPFREESGFKWSSTPPHPINLTRRQI